MQLLFKYSLPLFSVIFFIINPSDQKWLIGNWQLTAMQANSWQSDVKKQGKANEFTSQIKISFTKDKEEGKEYEVFKKGQVIEEGSWVLDPQETYITLNSEKGASTIYGIKNFNENNLIVFQVIENDTLTLSFQKQ